jgi:hypothetical protein
LTFSPWPEHALGHSAAAYATSPRRVASRRAIGIKRLLCRWRWTSKFRSPARDRFLGETNTGSFSSVNMIVRPLIYLGTMIIQMASFFQYLVIFLSSAEVIGVHYSPYCKCRNNQTSTIVIADGASGSTWLGQMLHQHPCSNGFISDSSRSDGKVFIR